MTAKKNVPMLLVTVLIFSILAALALLINRNFSGQTKWILYTPILLFQALWLDRLYVIGHEASHRKLFTNSKLTNEIFGFLILLPLMVPLRIYRTIHNFHHKHNRSDVHTSALDVFVSKRRPNLLSKIYFNFLWYFAVFGTGFFLHSLISVLLFLFVPVRLSRKISPAFNDWTIGDQLNSVMQFIGGIGFHLGIYYFAGAEIYLYVLGYPMLVFAWIWSMLVYIFHYDTTMGEKNVFHARALKSNWLFRNILLNFNEHVTHHVNPGISWFDLPDKRVELPENFRSNIRVNTLAGAILQQFRGPKIIWKPEK